MFSENQHSNLSGGGEGGLQGKKDTERTDHMRDEMYTNGGTRHKHECTL